MGGLRPKSTPKVGSAEPLATASLWSVCGFLHRLHGGLQIRPRGQRHVVELFQGHQIVGEIERPGDVEPLHRRAVVEQRQQRDLGGPQIHLRGLQVGFVLDALQLDAVQIHPRDVAGLKTVAADGQLLFEVVQVLLGQRQQRLGLERLHESVAQVEQQSALQVRLLRLGDGGALLGALQAQFALVLPLVQIAEGDQGKGIAERAVGIAGEGVELVDGRR